MLGSPLQGNQFKPAAASQYPELIAQAHKWATPEECTRTVKEQGRSMIEIHTLITQQTGIAQRLEHCKQQRQARKKEAQRKKAQQKRQRRNTNTNTNTNTDADTDTEDESEAEAETEAEAAPTRARVRQSVGRAVTYATTEENTGGINAYVSAAVPESILDERVVRGVKQYLITWQDLTAWFDRYVECMCMCVCAC